MLCSNQWSLFTQNDNHIQNNFIRYRKNSRSINLDEKKIQILPANSIEQIAKNCMLHIFHLEQHCSFIFIIIIKSVWHQKDRRIVEKKISIIYRNTHAQRDTIADV